MNEQTTHQLDRLLEAVLASSKYRHIDNDFIRSIGAGALSKRPPGTSCTRLAELINWTSRATLAGCMNYSGPVSEKIERCY